MTDEDGEGVRDTLRRLRAELASVRFSLLVRKYSPDQPRAPAGGPDGGRWVSDGLGAATGGLTGADTADAGLLFDAAWRPTDRVDLRQEELQGGHAIERHVGKSDGWLRARLEGERADTPDISYIHLAEGSFATIEIANNYTNDVLNSFPSQVENVASGRLDEIFLQKRYNSPTGREAWRVRGDLEGIVRLRPTYWVGVYIVHVRHGKGFVVRTSYPKIGTQAIDALRSFHDIYG